MNENLEIQEITPCLEAEEITTNDRCSEACNCRIPFSVTTTLPACFNASGLQLRNATIIYCLSGLGYLVEECELSAQPPCGTACTIPAFQVRLTGCIPFVVSIPGLSGGCGTVSSIPISLSGLTRVNHIIDYICGSEAPNPPALSCSNAVVNLSAVAIPVSGGGTNVTVSGTFTLRNIGSCN